MEAAETRAQKAARLRPELFRLLLQFDPPVEERSEAEEHLMQAKDALRVELHKAEAERLRRKAEDAQRLLMETRDAMERHERAQEWGAHDVAYHDEKMHREDAKAAQWAYDGRPLAGSRFQGTCRTTRDGGGLPEGSIIPSGITHDLVLQFDLPARRMEREERLLAFNGGDVNETLWDICDAGGGKDARFLLAHGADANYVEEGEGPAIWWAASHGHLSVVEALLDGGVRNPNDGLVAASRIGHTGIVALLLDRGADVHYEDDLALYWAAAKDRLEIATLLLQRGASTTGRHNILASAHGDDVANLLRAHGAV